MKHFDISDYSVVFLSYDEPNADFNYQQLLTVIPWAKRIHGVKGSDAAHKACAEISDTERLIIIDGDNFVYPEFLRQIIRLEQDMDLTSIVFGWPSYNIVNGLLYGNGSIKSWTRTALNNMKTHENSDPTDQKSQVDFCWDLNFIAIDRCFSDVVINITKSQAFRAGFREGVKLSLDNGVKPADINQTDKDNLRRLKTWLTVGLDVDNGIWAILGAWYGFYKTTFTDWDYREVRDFDFLNNFYQTYIHKLSEKEAQLIISKYILKIKSIKNDFLIIPPYDRSQSIFYKSLNNNPYRQPFYVKSFNNPVSQYDIVMITYDEPEADKNFELLSNQFLRAKRVHGIAGIREAHIVAANSVSTEMFWVVDGDAIIADNFNFDFTAIPWDTDAVHVWRSQNSANGLSYGYGGVKLLPTELTKNLDKSNPDIATSISNKFITMDGVSNISNFNTSAFHAWRSAFRECCKLASKIIDRQKDQETIERLNVWCTVGKEKPYGGYVIDGANAGKKYGELHKNDVQALKKINDFNWLKIQFENEYKQ